MKKIAFFFLPIVLLAVACNPKQPSLNLDSQAKCATQSKEVFDNLNNGLYTGGLTYDYQNHYNNQLNKCFILITGSGPGGASAHLQDAFENNTLIANCDSFVGAPMANGCSYNGVGEKYDLGKFDAFVKSYMNN